MMPPEVDDVVDTTGAGDAFLEGSLWVSVVSVLCRREQEGEKVSFILKLV